MFDVFADTVDLGLWGSPPMADRHSLAALRGAARRAAVLEIILPPLRRVPGLAAFWRATVASLRRARLRRLGRAERFERIYRRNSLGGRVSRSGLGSDPEATVAVRAALPGLVRELGVRTLVDVPCGDFQWMRQVSLPGVERYIGLDIVPGGLRTHHWRYSRNSLRSAAGISIGLTFRRRLSTGSPSCHIARLSLPRGMRWSSA